MGFLQNVKKALSEKSRGQFNALVPAVIGLVIVSVVLGFGALIVDDIQDEIADQSGNTSIAFNVTQEGLNGLDTLGGFLPVIAIVIAAVIVLGIVIGIQRLGQTRS